MIKYSKDGRCKFDSQYHTYHIGKKRLTGVTTFIGKYKEPFDALKIATAYVAKNGGNVQDLLVKWKKAGEDSCIAGTAVHDVFEQYSLTGAIQNKGIHKKELVAAKFIIDKFIREKLFIVEAECVVYDERLGVASMIDMVARTANNDYFILDWKSNKEIKKDSWGKMMLPPFSYLPDANYYHYSLQTKLYRHMYNDHPIKDCYIVHISEDDYKTIKAHEDNTDLYTLLGVGRLG